MIVSASGKPMARAPAIVKLNAVSRFTSGRNLSTDMLFSPTPGGGGSSQPAVTASARSPLRCRKSWAGIVTEMLTNRSESLARLASGSTGQT
jgi:hypothetical protein